MFVANSLIAIILIGNMTMVPAALISAGIGTIIYLVLTKLRSPVFLGSSAALLPVMITCYSMNGGGNFLALFIGLLVVGLVYTIVGLIIKKVGVNWLNKMLPPVVVGSVIMLIGLGLASFATDWSMFNNGAEYSL